MTLAWRGLSKSGTPGFGVVVVKKKFAGEVAKASTARIAKEEQSRAKLKAGELGLDFYGLREKLVKAGVEWVDSE